nr:transmembrane protein 101 isoform X1 [Chrysemys picta bellii]
MAAAGARRRRLLRLLMQLGSVLLTRFPFWNCLSALMLFAERADARRKPDIPVPYLYLDMGAAVLCASFMSFGVKRRWFALGAALQLAVSTYAAYIGGYVHYGDWLKVRMYSRTIAIIGGFLILASGAGEIYRQKPRSRSLQSTGQVFLGIYLICVAYSLQHSKEDRLAYLNHILGGEITLQLLFILYGVLALSFLSGYYISTAAQILSVILPLVILFIDGNLGYWHDSRRVEFWNQMKLIGQNNDLPRPFSHVMTSSFPKAVSWGQRCVPGPARRSPGQLSVDFPGFALAWLGEGCGGCVLLSFLKS